MIHYFYNDGTYYGCAISSNDDDNDCMNFSSQVMRAGGMPFVPTSPPWANWAEQWYFDFAHSTSSMTWRYAPSFMEYRNYRSADFANIYSVSLLRKGDLIPMDLLVESGEPGHDGKADHMRVFVGAGLSSPFSEDYDGGSFLVFSPEFELLIDQHSTDRWQVPWNYNATQADFLGYYIRIIK
jgi:hypothetical protein